MKQFYWLGNCRVRLDSISPDLCTELADSLISGSADRFENGAVVSVGSLLTRVSGGFPPGSRRRSGSHYKVVPACGRPP